MKTILQKILAILAKLTIKRYKPMIIGITGSVGKTSTREAIFNVLKKKYQVRQPAKNFNNEIGLPLTILGLEHAGKNIFGWLRVFSKALKLIISRRNDYPEILVLEYGVDRPGDMSYLLRIAKPKIVVVTALGEVPAHVEFFKDPEELFKEKSKIVKALPANGQAILNHDDFVVYDLKGLTKAKVISYGFEAHAEIRAINYELRLAKDEELGDIPDGISFKMEYGGSVVPIRIHQAFGEPPAYSALAAAAVGLALNMNLVEISEALAEWVPLPGRLRLIKGIKKSFILDDTYNASPSSMRAALDVLKNLPGRRKIAVLGDMLELGRYTEQVHRAIGDKAVKFADLIITVGARAKFIADQAMVWDFPKEQVLRFDDAVSAGKALDQLIREGDLILIKCSQGMRMEKAVEEIMAHPEMARELLVRQEEYWSR